MKTRVRANACNNNIPVFNVPRGAQLSWDSSGGLVIRRRFGHARRGKHLIVAKGKGWFPRRIPWGRQAGRKREARQQVDHGVVPVSPQHITCRRARIFTKQLARGRSRLHLQHRNGTVQRSRRGKGNTIPRKTGGIRPIKYVRVSHTRRRSRTRFSAICPRATADARLCIFPWRVTPNHKKLCALLYGWIMSLRCGGQRGGGWMGLSGRWRVCHGLCRENVADEVGHNRTKKIPLSRRKGRFRLPRRRPVIYGIARRGEGTYRSYGGWVQQPEAGGPAFTS